MSERRKATSGLRNRLRDVFIAEAGLSRRKASRLATRCIDVIADCSAKPLAVDKASQCQPSPAPLFDPYAFGAVAVLMREGRDRLLARLEAITTIEHLRLLAQAQNLSIPAALRRIDEVRLAVVESAEGRIAQRRAAAS